MDDVTIRSHRVTLTLNSHAHDRLRSSIAVAGRLVKNPACDDTRYMACISSTDLFLDVSEDGFHDHFCGSIGYTSTNKK